MGCTNELNELEEIDFPIRKINTNYNFNNNHLKDLLITFNNLLKLIETYRKILIDKKEKIIYLTGCCCLKKHSLENCLVSLFKTLGVITKGNINEYKNLLNKNFDKPLPICLENVDYLIREYVEDIKNIMNNFNKTIENFELSYKGIIDSSNKIINEISQDNFEKEIKKLNLIKDKIIPKIQSRFRDDCNFYEKFNKVFDKSLVDKYNAIGKNNIKNNFNNQFEIVYNLSTIEERFGNSPDEGKKRFFIKIKAKNEFLKLKSIIAAN